MNLRQFARDREMICSDFQRKVENCAGRMTIFTAVSGAAGNFRSERIHNARNRRCIAAARSSVARNSVLDERYSSIRICNAAGNSASLSLAAVRHCAMSSVNRCCCGSVKNRSERRFWTITSVPASSALNCAVMRSKRFARRLPDGLPLARNRMIQRALAYSASFGYNRNRGHLRIPP